MPAKFIRRRSGEASQAATDGCPGFAVRFAKGGLSYERVPFDAKLAYIKLNIRLR